MYKCNGCGEEFEKARKITWGDEDERVCPECGSLDFTQIENCETCGHPESKHDGDENCKFEDCQCDMFHKDEETAEAREERIRSILPSKKNLENLLT
jgi:putative FmdB family regulatory protein